MLIVHKLKVGQGEGFFNQFCQFVLDGFRPMANEDDELVDGPSHTASWYLSIVALEFCLIMLGLGAEILFGPNLTVQMGVVDKGLTLLGSFLYFTWGKLFLTYTKECVIFGVIPEDAYGWHRFIEGTHVVHLGFMAYFIEVRHIH